MKRKLLLFLAIAATVALQASDICVDGIYYLFNGDEATVTYKGAIHYEDMKFYHDTVTIPEKVTYKDKVYPVTQIGEGAFWCCQDLTCVNIPNSVKVIGTSAFYFCSLEEVNIPDGVDSIAPHAFEAQFFKKLTIGKGLRTVAISAISGDDALVSIEVSPCNPYFTSGDHCNAIINRETKELILGCQNTKIPNYVKKIGVEAFYWCMGLTKIEIPQNVEILADGAFNACGLQEVILGPDVKVIGSGCFDMCMSLIKVTSYSTTPPTFVDGDYGFGLEEEVPIAIISVPTGTKGAYMATTGWGNYDNYEEIVVPSRKADEVMPPIKCEETDLDIIPANNELSTRKVIRNGRLFLYNNEHIYTITGAKLQ